MEKRTRGHLRRPDGKRRTRNLRNGRWARETPFRCSAQRARACACGGNTNNSRIGRFGKFMDHSCVKDEILENNQGSVRLQQFGSRVKCTTGTDERSEEDGPLVERGGKEFLDPECENLRGFVAKDCEIQS